MEKKKINNMKLIELSNGDWINPDTIVAIRKGKKTTSYGSDEIIKDRYIIDYGTTRRSMESWINSIIVYCDDMEQVDREVEELGELINHGCQEKES